ncbi:MAG TPA: flavin reductase family protein [Acidimicrobiales bacterium]|nr:flavin reductase family protein [Acidimicrobiales bacterium]
MPEPTGQPVGPFPAGVDPEDYDRLRRRVLWSMPSGLYVVGSRAGDRQNGMTCNWATQVATNPKLVGVSVERGALTHELVEAGGAFSLSVLAREDRALVRRFVKPVEADPDARTLNGFAYTTAVTGAPILEAAVAWVDCRLDRTLDAGSHTLFVGEVVAAGFQRPEDTPVLRMEDTRMSYGG